jgi:hypothetical protein
MIGPFHQILQGPTDSPLADNPSNWPLVGICESRVVELADLI